MRVPNLDPDLLTTYANTGVAELVLPRVRSIGELTAAGAALRYAPAGNRSRQVVPATAYGADWDREVRVSVIIETVDAVSIAAEMAAHPLVAGVWIGPRDLEDDHLRQGLPVDMAGLVGELTAGLRGAPSA